MSLTEETPPSHQLTSCGRVCLTWIALQYAVRLDQLRRLLYRYTPEADRYKLKSEVDFLSLDRVYKWINKMLDFGLIEKKTILHGDQTWIWLSRALAHSQARSAPGFFKVAQHVYNPFRQRKHLSFLFSQSDLSEAYSAFLFLSSDWIKSS